MPKSKGKRGRHIFQTTSPGVNKLTNLYFSAFLVLIIIAGAGFTAYASSIILTGHISTTNQISTENRNKTRDAQPEQSNIFDMDKSWTGHSRLENKYGAAAKSPIVAAEIERAESANRMDAKKASDRFEALMHGYALPGTNPMDILAHGYVPPNMDPELAAELYRGMPHLPRVESPSERIARMAAEPLDPESYLSGMVPGMPQLSKAERQMSEQKWLEDYMRENHGPVLVPPLHRDPNWLALHGRKNEDGTYTVPIANQLQPFKAQYAYQARNGSVSEMTDSSGNVVAQYTYNAYGQPTKVQGSQNSDFLYKGYYYHQPSGLYFSGNRVYSPSLGRWLSRNQTETVSGNNLYMYSRNNPVKYRQPPKFPPGINPAASTGMQSTQFNNGRF